MFFRTFFNNIINIALDTAFVSTKKYIVSKRPLYNSMYTNHVIMCNLTCMNEEKRTYNCFWFKHILFPKYIDHTYIDDIYTNDRIRMEA